MIVYQEDTLTQGRPVQESRSTSKCIPVFQIGVAKRDGFFPSSLQLQQWWQRHSATDGG